MDAIQIAGIAVCVLALVAVLVYFCEKGIITSFLSR